MDNTEIMIEMKDEELSELAEMYKPYENDLPQVYSFIQNCIKAKKIGKYDFVTVMSPRGCWREDGTFFALMPQFGNDIFLHSLDESGKNVIDGILHTQKFKFPSTYQERPFTLLFAVPEKLYSRIRHILTNPLHCDLIFEDTCTMYSLQKELSLEASISIPPDAYIKEIDPTDPYIMDSVWPQRFPYLYKKLIYLFELNKGYGVYLKSNNQLVSWVTLCGLGQLSALQTLEDYKKKGYATIITKYTCKKLAENGFHSFATVTVGNRPSELLFEKLGFKKMGFCKYTGVKIFIPPDVYIKEIDPADAFIINSVWPKRFPGSEKKLIYLFELNKGYGVYLKSNDQLVSWVTLSSLGQLSALQTLEDYKKKGYATIITKYMCKKLAENGFHSFATVVVGNRSSELLFEKLGFRKIGFCKYTGVKIL